MNVVTVKMFVESRYLQSHSLCFIHSSTAIILNVMFERGSLLANAVIVSEKL